MASMPSMYGIWPNSAVAMSTAQHKHVEAKISHLKDLLVIMESLVQVLQRQGLMPGIQISPLMEEKCMVFTDSPYLAKIPEKQIVSAHASLEAPEKQSALSDFLDNDIDWDVLLGSVSPALLMPKETSHKRKSCKEEAQACCVVPMKWRKYAQKRVAYGDIRHAILKQSYKCTIAGCDAVKVTLRNTGRDGPSGALNYEFHGTHTHDIPLELHTLMGASTTKVFPDYNGGRLKKKRN